MKEKTERSLATPFKGNPSRGLLIVESMAILYGSTPTIISLRLESEGASVALGL